MSGMRNSVLGWEEWGIENASAFLGNSLRYLNRTWIFSIPLRAEPLGIYPLLNVYFPIREQKTWYLRLCLGFRKSVSSCVLHLTDDFSIIIFFSFSFVFPTERATGRDHFLLGVTAGLLHCHIDMD